MAQLAFESYQKRLELALAGFQYKNQLILDQTNKKLEVESLYYQRWQDVLAQMNTENALAEEIRQFNASQAMEQAQFAESVRQFHILNQDKVSKYYGTSFGSGSSSSGSGSISAATRKANQSNKDRAKLESGGGSDDLPSDTRDSILALGQGPISESNLKNQIDSGKVTVSSSTTTGNPIVKYNNLK